MSIFKGFELSSDIREGKKKVLESIEQQILEKESDISVREHFISVQKAELSDLRKLHSYLKYLNERVN